MSRVLRQQSMQTEKRISSFLFLVLKTTSFFFNMMVKTLKKQPASTALVLLRPHVLLASTRAQTVPIVLVPPSSYARVPAPRGALRRSHARHHQPAAPPPSQQPPPQPRSTQHAPRTTHHTPPAPHTCDTSVAGAVLVLLLCAY